MAVRPIVVLGNSVLRTKAKKVSRFDDSLKKLVDDMIETMRAAPGVGLAAPQIGVPLQIAVIEAEPGEVHVILNPEITKCDGEQEVDEGCLSVPGYWANLTRANAVVVKARDLKGKEIRFNAEGFLAQVFQHEIDHLHGMLYIDRLDSVDDLQRSKVTRRRKDSDPEPESPPESSD